MASPSCFYNETVAFFYNNSRKELPTHWRPKDVLVVALGLAVSAGVLLANLLVVAAVAADRRLHYPIYYLLANLAAADLFAAVAYTFLMFHTGPRTAGLSLRAWFVRQSLLDTSLTASVANLLAIAVERRRAVLAVQLHSRMSKRRVAGLVLGIWGAALLLGVIPSYGWHCLCDLERCSRMAPLYSRGYLLFWAGSNLAVFALMAVAYAHIFVYVRRRMGRVARHGGGHPRYRETMVGLVKTVTIILGAFLVCWTPGQVVLLLDGLGCVSCDVLAVEKFVLLLAEANSLINAVVYSYRDSDMRSTFRRLLCLPCPKNSREMELSRAPKARDVPGEGEGAHNGHFSVDSSV